MNFGDMVIKVEKDLNIPHRRARGYIEVFKEKYTGRKEAISDVKASYGPDGDVLITYAIKTDKRVVHKTISV